MESPFGQWLDPEVSVLLAAAGPDFFSIGTEQSTTSYSQVKGFAERLAGRALYPWLG
jgi:hypothetical protein